MEIAFFTDSFLPTRDGVAAVTSALARELQAQGHAVTVFAPNPTSGAPPDEVQVEDIPVVRVRSLPVPLYSEYHWGLFPFAQLRGRDFGNRFDVVHLHTPGMMGSTAFLAARHFGMPLVGTFHTNVAEMRESFPSNLWVRLFFWAATEFSLGIYYRCDLTTVPTEPAREWLLGHSTKRYRRAPEVVPNGIEVERFRPGLSVPDWRERCGLPSAPLVTYLGRLTIDKGIHRFLDALSELPARQEFVGIVGGTGPEEASVRARLRVDARLAGRVRFVGPVAEAEKPALLAQSDLFVLPSTSDTSSIALLEAMACGTPCLASDQGGLRDLLQDRSTGRLVSVAAPGALATAIGELLEHPAERARLGRAALVYVRREASIARTATRFIALYELLLSEKRSGVAGPT